MATPEKHAICSASSSARWLHCTAAPRFEEQFESKTTSYAEEGRLAHAVCELKGRKKFSPMSQTSYTRQLAELKRDPLWDDEMLHTADFYVQYLTEKAMEYDGTPVAQFEVQVDFSDTVPEGFGTCDSIMICGDLLRITDYKHGKGVAVSSINNSQMRLYALGALNHYAPLFGDRIKRITTAIVQPRITEDITEETLTVEELRAWAEDVKPKARAAFTGMGATFEPGEWCRFCRGRSVCRARADKYTAFNDFKDCVPAGIAEDLAVYHPEDKIAPEKVLSNEQVGELLTQAEGLIAWYDDLKAYAQEEILGGREVPGWKVVEGRSTRAFSDTDKAFDVLQTAGIDPVMLYERKPKTLAVLEKMIGKKRFGELVGDLIVRPAGKPTLADAADRREPYSPAEADFKGV